MLGICVKLIELNGEEGEDDGSDVVVVVRCDRTGLRCASAPDPAPDHVKLACLRVAMRLAGFKYRRFREMRESKVSSVQPSSCQHS